MVSLGDMSDPAFLASKEGYKVGGLYVCKSEADKAVYVLESMDETTCFFKSQPDAVTGNVLEKSVIYDALVKTMKPLPTSMADKQYVKLTAPLPDHLPASSASFRKDAERARLYLELWEHAKMHQASNASVEYYLHPANVRSKLNAPKGNIKLVPATDLQRIAHKSATSQFVAHGPDEATLFMDAPLKPRSAEASEWKAVAFSPFWWVKPTSNSAEANMKLGKMKLGAWSVPVFENHKPVKANDVLMYLEKEEPAAKRAR